MWIREEPWRAEQRPLEPNLYDGSAGVGLFLAHLAVVTGDVAVRQTALGAMRHAFARAPAMACESRDGLHAGSLGIAWAIAYTGALLDIGELRSNGRELAVAAPPLSGPARSPDVILGSAGAIIALLALGEEFDDPQLVGDAISTGDELIGRATVTRHGWSWATPGNRYRQDLCGLSHGAAGIGWALLELFASTGEERFRTAATEAFAYERSWLDETSGTWPDLRSGGQRRGAQRRIASTALGTWCHGEGGIALTRLRALQVLDSPDYGQDAETALEATRRELTRSLPHEIEDLTLCHGAAGAADVLACGAAVLGTLWNEAAALGSKLGHVALQRYGAPDKAWPCGSLAGTTPGLFRGLSGIGWWFLRLHDGAIPSPLTLPHRGLTAPVVRA